MSKKNLIAIACISSALSVACAGKSEQDLSKLGGVQNLNQIGPKGYARLEFELGNTRLTEVQKLKLRDFTKDLPLEKIKEILVFAWADREYSVEAARA